MPNKLVIDSAMLTELHALIKAKAEAEKRAAENHVGRDLVGKVSPCSRRFRRGRY
jgi:hypothetical protein